MCAGGLWCPPCSAVNVASSLAWAPNVQVYLQHVLHLLQSAMALSVQQIPNDDLSEYNNSLRHGEMEVLPLVLLLLVLREGFAV